MARGSLAAVALALAAVGCDDAPESHVFVAAPFVPDAGCFGLSVSVAFVDTADASLDCAPVCLVAPATGGPLAVFVTTMCGPYPTGYDTSQSDATCQQALAAWPAEQAALAAGTDSCATRDASVD